MMSDLTPIAALACDVFGAVACSVALVEGEELHYVAAAGATAAAVTGLRLELGRGIAGYVAVAGEALEVDGVMSDPRFARDVAEDIGYLPRAILAAPLVTPEGEVVGVLSVLDRAPERVGSSEAVRLACRVADVAAIVASRAPVSDAGAFPALAERIDGSGRPAGERRLLHGLAALLADQLAQPDARP